MRTISFGAAGVLVLLAAPPVGSRSADAATLVADAMTKYRLPSLSASIGRAGRVVSSMAAGLADVENATPATSRTVYRVGSVAKTLTAVATLQLVARGALDLDAPVQRYCPAFPMKPQPITARQLLAHLGGIRDYNYQRFTEEFLSARRYASVDEALGIFKDDPLAGEPGASYRYSSFGFVLLGCVLEGAGHAPYGAQVQERILSTSGMTATRLDVPESVIPWRAHPYSRNKDGSLANSPFVDLSDRYPAGGWLATPEDLVRFGLSVLSDRLMSAAMRQAAWTRQKTTSGGLVDYGLGWKLSPDGREAFHGGTSVGGSAYLYIALDTGTVVAFATNVDLWTDGRHELAQALATAR